MFGLAPASCLRPVTLRSEAAVGCQTSPERPKVGEGARKTVVFFFCLFLFFWVLLSFWVLFFFSFSGPYYDRSKLGLLRSIFFSFFLGNPS